MSQEDVAVVQSAYEAFWREDVQAIFALLHPEIELYQSEWVSVGREVQGARGSRILLQQAKRNHRVEG